MNWRGRLEGICWFSVEPSGRRTVTALLSDPELRTSMYTSEPVTKNVIGEGLIKSVILPTSNDPINLPSCEIAIRLPTALELAVRKNIAPSGPHLTGAAMNGFATKGTSTVDSTRSVVGLIFSFSATGATDDSRSWPTHSIDDKIKSSVALLCLAVT